MFRSNRYLVKLVASRFDFKAYLFGSIYLNLSFIWRWHFFRGHSTWHLYFFTVIAQALLLEHVFDTDGLYISKKWRILLTIVCLDFLLKDSLFSMLLNPFPLLFESFYFINQLSFTYSQWAQLIFGLLFFYQINLVLYGVEL